MSFEGKASPKAAFLVGRSSFTRVNFQTPKVVYSINLENYSYTKVAKTLLVDRIKSNQHNDKVVDYVFNGYPKRSKDYKLLGVEPRA